MATQDRKLAIQAYRARLEAAFQTGSKLSNFVTWQNGVEAEAYRFPIDGIADVTSKASGADVTPVDIENARPTAYLESKYSTSYLDPQDTRLSNVDFMRSRADKHAKAIKRAWDGEILRVLNTFDTSAYSRAGLTTDLTAERTGSYVPAANQGAAGGVPAQMLAHARGLLVNEDMDEGAEEICAVLPAGALASMMTDDRLANFDYTEQGRGERNVGRTGMFQMLYGMTPVFVGREGARAAGLAAGQLPANVGYVFAKSAVGMAEGTNKNMMIHEWSVDKQSWLIGARCNFGATRIQNAGIVRLDLS